MDAYKLKLDLNAEVCDAKSGWNQSIVVGADVVAVVVLVAVVTATVVVVVMVLVMLSLMQAVVVVMAVVVGSVWPRW